MHLRYYFNYVDDHCYILLTRPLMMECFIENIWWHSCTVVTIIECQDNVFCSAHGCTINPCLQTCSTWKWNNIHLETIEM